MSVGSTLSITVAFTQLKLNGNGYIVQNVDNSNFSLSKVAKFEKGDV